MSVAKRSSSGISTIAVWNTVLLTTTIALPLASQQARAADLPVAPPPALPAAAPSATEAKSDRFAFVTQRLSEWKVVLGGGVRIGPKYEGSDEFKAMPLPFVSATFGDMLKIDPRGASVNVFRTHGLSFSARFGYDLGRKEDDSDRLRGLGDIDASAVVGARIGYELGPIELYTAVDRNIGGSDGLQVRFGAEATHRYERFLFGAGVSGTWADSRYMRTYFGITPQQSAASGLAIYDIGSGLKRFDVEASVAYMLTKNWMIRGQVGVGFLSGDAGNSPIVQSKSQPYGMLTIGYRF